MGLLKAEQKKVEVIPGSRFDAGIAKGSMSYDELKDRLLRERVRVWNMRKQLRRWQSMHEERIAAYTLALHDQATMENVALRLKVDTLRARVDRERDRMKWNSAAIGFALGAATIAVIIASGLFQ